MADKSTGVSRRDVLRGAGAAAFFGAVSGVDAQERPGSLVRVGPGAVPVSLTVNGKPTVLEVEPRVTLLDALRDRAGLTGTKRICDRGACGGCTVWVDGKTVNSCMMLAVDAAGHSVTTIEGLAQNGKLHPVQAAFVKHDALQCGFCTPGMIMSCAALVGRTKDPTQAEIREAVSGNLCRCGVYPHVFAAVKEAAR
jgi:aerobic-type carbon monoxide dehydrogenase small subunit (CoxS/CutS family)